MARRKAGARRDGEHARGAAKLHQQRPDLPHAASPAYQVQYASRGISVADLTAQNGAGKRKASVSIAEVGAAAHRTSHERAGSGWTGGKVARTLQRRIIQLEAHLKREQELFAESREHAQKLEAILANRETYLRPEAERLNIDTMHLQDKVTVLRLFFVYRSEGRGKVWASEEAGFVALIAGTTVRRWVSDWLSERLPSADEPEGKPRFTFSPSRLGRHVTWLLSDEHLASKAHKWIGQHAEKKGGANMQVRDFCQYLSGTWDEDAGEWSEKGLLSDVLEAQGKHGLSERTALTYLHRLGYSYDLASKNVYCDGHDREDVVKFRNETYLPQMREMQRRGYYWVPESWLEKAENWPSAQAHAEWVAGGKPEVHIDRFEWKSAKTPDGVDRFAEWGIMGGDLSKRMLPCERPVIEVLQDETTVRQYDCQKKCWRHEGNARNIAPKGEGAAVMLSGMIVEVDGGFPVLTREDVEA
jgi:hypothetical protein